MRTGNGRPRPRSVDVAPRDHCGVCCRAGIASGIGLLWNPWRGSPKAYRIFVAMPALPALKCAPHPTRLTQVVQVLINLGNALIQRLIRRVGSYISFEMAPEVINRIQLWACNRQPP